MIHPHTLYAGVRPHGFFFHAAVTAFRQIDTGHSHKYSNHNRQRNCVCMAPMRLEVANVADVTVTISAITVIVRETAAAWTPCKIEPMPQLKNFFRMMRPKRGVLFLTCTVVHPVVYDIDLQI